VMCCYAAGVKNHSSGASCIFGVSRLRDGVLDALEVPSLKLQGAGCAERALRPRSMAERVSGCSPDAGAGSRVCPAEWGCASWEAAELSCVA